MTAIFLFHETGDWEIFFQITPNLAKSSDETTNDNNSESDYKKRYKSSSRNKIWITFS